MKSKFKKIWLTITIGIVSALAPIAHALDPSATKEILKNTISTDATLETPALAIVKWVLGATFTFAVIMIIIGGFRYVASAGNEDQAEIAKETITKAIIGLAVVILAFVILLTVQVILTGGCTGSVDSEGSTTSCSPI